MASTIQNGIDHLRKGKRPRRAAMGQDRFIEVENTVTFGALTIWKFKLEFLVEWITLVLDCVASSLGMEGENSSITLYQTPKIFTLNH